MPLYFMLTFLSVAGFVINSVLFPMSLMFLAAKLVDAVGFGPPKSPGYPCEVSRESSGEGAVPALELVMGC